MHRKLLLTAALVAGALALATGGCTSKTDDHYEGKVKSNAPSATTPGAKAMSPGPGAKNTTPGAKTTAPTGKNPRVVIKTSLGSILIELYAEKAPITVKNFLRYVDSKFYDNTIFHRVMSNFMIQGGGFTTDRNKKPTRAPIKNEANNGLRNTRYTVAMARTSAVNSATAQFFINVKDNQRLNHRGPGSAFGYCVFARVIGGKDVVEKIRNTPTRREGMLTHLPQKPVLILQARRLK
jgi:peptidyl-prolyl cis-trans isomerase A (cyclophilin A)